MVTDEGVGCGDGEGDVEIGLGVDVRLGSFEEEVDDGGVASSGNGMGAWMSAVDVILEGRS